ncbi:MAG: NrfD/PsrC family molybdoenzyme membrane anchor subunit [bacterium]
MKLPKITFWRIVIGIIIVLGLYYTFIRYTRGLGAVTNLSDKYPWGLWVGFDVITGVGLAAGAFIIALTVYIFHIDNYKPILRPAILTGFLGYALVAVGLLYDLGKWFDIWHAIIFWNPHSVMFEVAWCVMLYLTVLALEFSTVVFERLNLHLLNKAIHIVIIPLAMLGVILSTLHQSSLGSLFLIVPTKLYPLWYSPYLPVFFFVSAVSVGLAMITMESFLSKRFLGKDMELDLLNGLARVNVLVMAFYLVIKMLDLANRGVLSAMFSTRFESIMFDIETFIQVIIPLVLLLIPSVRTSAKGLFVVSLFIVVGFIMNRLDVTITGIEASSGTRYIPSFGEISISAFLVTMGFLAFAFAAKYLNVFVHVEEKEEEPVEVIHDV